MKLSKKLLSLLLCAIMVLGSVAIGGGGFAEVLNAFNVTAEATYTTGFPLDSSKKYKVSALEKYSTGSTHSGYLCTYVTSGANSSLWHMDIVASAGSTIYAVASGKVITNTYGDGGGNYVVISHNDGTYSYYGHMREKSSLKVGATVSAGTVIGYVGMTGTATGYHLHFEWSGHDPYCEFNSRGYISGLVNAALVYPHTHSTSETPPGSFDVSLPRLVQYGQPVTLSWTSAPNATNYYISAFKNDTERIIGESDRSMKREMYLDVGEYSFLVLAKNIYGETRPNQGWVTCTVYDDLPGKFDVSMDRRVYLEGESVKVTWTAATHTVNYWFELWRGNERIASEIDNSRSRTMKLEKGHYDLLVQAMNGVGNTRPDSGWISFDVGDTVPPEVEYSITNNLSSTQTLTIDMSDNYLVKEMYLGTSTNYLNNERTAVGDGVPDSGSYVVTDTFQRAISNPGTYYLTVIDYSGNKYSSPAIVFRKTTLNANGGSVSISNVLTADGKSFKLPSATKTGYLFKGWNTKSDGTGTNYSSGASYKPTSTTTLYAIWEANKYTVAFNANGGSGAPSSQTKSYGTSLTLSSTKPTRTGYTFKNWNTKADGTGTSYSSGGSYTVNSAVTLYAQWTVNTYTVTFNANGGTTPTGSKSVTYGSTYGTLPTPTYTGYIFNGWYTAASGGTQINSDSTVSITASQTLYAHWTAVTLSSITVKTNPTKTNYYTGDALDTAGLTLTTKYSDNSTKTISSGFTCTPTTLNTAGNQTITVSYGGKNTTFTVYVTAVVLAEISVKNNPTKVNYYVGDLLVTDGLTLTATYNNGTTSTITSGFACTPSTLLNEGSQSVDVTYGGKSTNFNVMVEEVELSSITIESSATKNDYYIGDSLDTAGLTLLASYNNGTTETITNGFTATADLSSVGTKIVTVSYGGKEVTYTVFVNSVPTANHSITYIVDGLVYRKTTYEEGEIINNPSNPEKTGYTFKCWEPAVPTTMQNSDLTVNAVFELASYNAVFMADGRTIETVPYTVNTVSVNEPDVPAKTGYDGKWQTYTLTPGGTTINAVYTSKSYTVKWIINGETITETYKYGENISEPMVTVAVGYEFNGWGTTVPVTMPANNLNFTASIIPIAYKASFVANGEIVSEADYYITTESIVEPDVPDKTGYTGRWQNYTLVPGGVTINALYSINSYNVIWNINGEKITESYKYGEFIEEPIVAPADGYKFIEWNSTPPQTMPAKSQNFTAVFAPITYYITFVADDDTVGSVEYNVENKKIKEPPVPSKIGHIGKWENYTIEIGDMTVNAVYTAATYSVKWIIDGEEYSESYMFGEMISVPSNPVKEGYVFIRWSPIPPKTMPANNQTYSAVFEFDKKMIKAAKSELEIIRNNFISNEARDIIDKAIEDLESAADPEIVNDIVSKAKVDAQNAENTYIETHKIDSVKIKVASEQKIDYRSIVTIKASATGVPDDYKLAIYLGSQKVAEGDNKSVSYEYGEIKSDINYTVKVIDANGKVQKDSNGNELTKDGGKITCNAGFFKKLIAFFKGLFKSLPKVEVKP